MTSFQIWRIGIEKCWMRSILRIYSKLFKPRMRFIKVSGPIWSTERGHRTKIKIRYRMKSFYGLLQLSLLAMWCSMDTNPKKIQICFWFSNHSLTCWIIQETQMLELFLLWINLTAKNHFWCFKPCETSDQMSNWQCLTATYQMPICCKSMDSHFSMMSRPSTMKFKEATNLENTNR